jgi:hypothetical protein
MPAQQKDNRVVVVDPKLLMERMLQYRERHRGWHIFRALFWSIYFIIIGVLLVYYNYIFTSVTLFLGTAFLVFAVMLILYGLTEALHHQFMRKFN